MKGLKKYRRNGKLYVYHRLTGVRLPSDVPEDDPAFLEAYLAAGRTTQPKVTQQLVVSGSIEDFARRYTASQEFLSLSESYQSVRRSDIRRMLAQKDGRLARLRLAEIRADHIRADIHALGINPGNERLKTWRALFRFACATGAVPKDPSKEVPKRSHAGRKHRLGHRPWSLEQVESFRAHFAVGAPQRTLFEILYWCGCRISDAVRIGWEDIDRDGWLIVKQKKTGTLAWVPFDRDLPDFTTAGDLAQFKTALAAAGYRSGPFLRTRNGGPRSEKSASQWFAQAAREAGIADRTAHGLRKSRMILHAENGATELQIAAWSGHEDFRQVQAYIREASRKRALTPDSSSLQDSATVDRIFETASPTAPRTVADRHHVKENRRAHRAPA